MNDIKIQAEIVKALESEDNYKQLVPNILKEVNANNKSYITNVISFSNTLITTPKYDSSTKFWALLLLKDVMQLNQAAFVAALGDSKVMGSLESIGVKNPKTDKDIELIFGKQANPSYSKKFYILMLECIKVWNSRHENAKGSLKKYNAVYAKLAKKGVQFPETFYFFPNKSDPQNESRNSIKQGNNPNAVNSNPPQNPQANMSSQFKSNQDVVNYIDAYKKKYQESLQQSFYYNAQELVDDSEDAPATQPPQQTGAISQQQTAPAENKVMKTEPSHKEEEAPMMYNAQELEVDEEEQKLEDQKAAAKKVEKLTADTKEEKQKAVGADKQAVGQANPAFALQGLLAGVKPVKAEVKETKPADQKAGTKETKTTIDPKATTNATKTDAKESKQPVTDSKSVTNITKTDPQENKSNNDQKLVPSVVKADPSVAKEAEKKDAITVKVNGETAQQKRESQANNKPGSLSHLDEKSNKDKSSKPVKEVERSQNEKEIGVNQNRETNTSKQTREGERANADKEIRSDPSKPKNVEDDQKTYTRESEPAKQAKDNGKAYTDKERRSEFVEDERAYKDSNQAKTDKAATGGVPSIVVANNMIGKSGNEGKRPSKAPEDDFETLQPPQLLNDINIKLQDLSAEQDFALGKSKNRIPGSQNALLNVIDNDSKAHSSFEILSNDYSRQIRKESIDDQLERVIKFSPQKDHAPSQGNLDAEQTQGKKQSAQQSQDAKKDSTAFNNRNASVNDNPEVHVNTYADQQRDSNKASRDGQQIANEAADQGQAKQRISSKNNLDTRDQEKQYTEKQNFGSNEAKGAVVDDVQASRGRSGSTHRGDKTDSNKDTVHLKRENDTLLAENRRIKEERDQLEMKLKVESEKNKNLQEHFERKRASESVDDRTSAHTQSYSSPKKSLYKTEIPSNTKNRYQEAMMTDFGLRGRSNQQQQQQQQPYTRGRSPKVETVNTVKAVKAFDMTKNFGPELRRRNEFYANEYSSIDDGYHKTMMHYANQSRKRSEVSPSMIKTEYVHRKLPDPFSTWSQPISYETKTFKRHENVHSSTDLHLLKLACLKEDHLLFENNKIRVDSQTYSGAHGSLIVVLGYTNKTRSVFEDFSVTYKSVSGYLISAEDAEVEPRLLPGERQFHSLNIQITGNPRDIGSMVIELRQEGEPNQLKLNYPLIITKFMNFLSVSPSDYLNRRKILLAKHPSNVEGSIKIQLNKPHLQAVENELFSKLMILPAEDGKAKDTRFRIMGGCFVLGNSSWEYILRTIYEIETQVVLIQINYSSGGQYEARQVVDKLSFLCNENSVL